MRCVRTSARTQKQGGLFRSATASPCALPLLLRLGGLLCVLLQQRYTLPCRGIVSAMDKAAIAIQAQRLCLCVLLQQRYTLPCHGIMSAHGHDAMATWSTTAAAAADQVAIAIQSQRLCLCVPHSCMCTTVTLCDDHEAASCRRKLQNVCQSLQHTVACASRVSELRATHSGNVHHHSRAQRGLSIVERALVRGLVHFLASTARTVHC